MFQSQDQGGPLAPPDRSGGLTAESLNLKKFTARPKAARRREKMKKILPLCSFVRLRRKIFFFASSTFLSAF
jgi:hypothetical protein